MIILEESQIYYYGSNNKRQSIDINNKNQEIWKLKNVSQYSHSIF